MRTETKQSLLLDHVESSAGELEVMRQAELRPLDLEAASRQEYDPTRFQPALFCADSFGMMFETLREFLLNWGR